MAAASLANMTQADNQWSATANSPELKSNKDAADQLNVGKTARNPKVISTQRAKGQTCPMPKVISTERAKG